MKHAVLMTVYKDLPTIKCCLATYPPPFNIYIHIDKKSDISVADFSECRNVTAIKKYNINWAGRNHLLAFIDLLKMAHRVGGYDYYHLATGQDSFVTDADTFNNYLSKYNGVSFVEAYRIPCKRYPFWEEGWGVIDYWMPTDILNYNLKTYLGVKLWRITKLAHKLFHYHRKRPRLPLYMGSVYCSISSDGAKAILSSKLFSPLLQRFKHTICSEGLFFNTILMNEGMPIENRNLTYTDWKSSKEKPKVLDESDYGKWGTEKFFIRKIDKNISKELLLKIYEQNHQYNKESVGYMPT